MDRSKSVKFPSIWSCTSKSTLSFPTCKTLSLKEIEVEKQVKDHNLHDCKYVKIKETAESKIIISFASEIKTEPYIIYNRNEVNLIKHKFIKPINLH